MDARVRPARAVHAHRLTGDLEKSGFDSVLNRVAIGLALPTGEVRAVVRDDQL